MTPSSIRASRVTAEAQRKNPFDGDRCAIRAKSRRYAGARRRGGVLFEIVLALALFGGAAAFTLVAVRSVYAALERARTRQMAVDLARTRLAELEAGLATISELRGEIEFPTRPSAELDQPLTGTRWQLELNTQPSEFNGLSLVELNVTELLPAGTEREPLQFTLRQLMRLRNLDREDAAGSIASGGAP